MRKTGRIAIVLVLALMLQSLTGFCGTSSVSVALAKGTSYRIEGTVTADYLNLRSGAGSKYTCLGTLTKNQSVTIIGTAKAGNGEVWYQLEATVSGKKVTGYAWSHYIKASKNVPGVTVTPAPTAKATATPTPAKKATATPTPAKKATATPTPTATVSTQKATGKVAVVNVTRMNVRKKPGTASDVLGKAYQGDRLPVLGTEKASDGYTWYLVEVNIDGAVKQGYVYGNFVTITSASSQPTATPTPQPANTPTNAPKATPTEAPKATPTEAPKATPTPVPSTDGKVAIVNATRMNVRSGATTASDVLGKAYQGEQYTVLGSSKDSEGRTWYLVEYPVNGVTKKAYLYGNFVTITSASSAPKATPTAVPTSAPDTSTAKPTESPKKVSITVSENKGRPVVEATVTAKSLNIRSGPGTEYVKVVTVEKGQPVTVVSFAYAEGGAVWYEGVLIVDGLEYRGYMYGSYISLSEKYPLNESNNSGSLHGSGSAAKKSDSSYAKQLRDAGFPESYIPYLTKLHEQHPTWKFKAYKTGLDWNDVIEGENTLGNNLIEKNKGISWLSYAPGSYNWRTGRFKSFDGKEWMMINSAGLQYYMDPRNWLDDTYIYMFEDLTYDPKTQTVAGVEKILRGTVMDGAVFSYIDANGKERSVTYAQAFMEAAAYSGVNPYHLASRVKQEVTSGGSFSLSATGTVEGFEGYYNFYNIGAYNSTAALGAIRNGLKYAKYGSTNASLNEKCKIPWDNRYDAIVGGAYYIGSTYIRNGQNTIYLQKYNVTGKNTYAHQYMSNAQAPKSEGYKVAQAYLKMGAVDSMEITFSIPVYNNMPASAVPEPGKCGSPNPYLSTLTVKTADGKSLSLNASFSCDVFEYTVTVPSGTKELSVAATAVVSGTKVTGTGKKSLTGKGDEIVVTTVAENGAKMNYRIRVKYK
ncbi:MAG: SH3 domain-containing protein [Lachnospiraceae bacterium]|nr:SH3 domain-containing protein [Lachnospiraceae bacterium]